MTSLSAPGTTGGLELAASGTLAMIFTSALLIGTRAKHSPARATTLIVGLGLMPTLVDGTIIVGAVDILCGLARTVRGGDDRFMFAKS